MFLKRKNLKHINNNKQNKNNLLSKSWVAFLIDCEIIQNEAIFAILHTLFPELGCEIKEHPSDKTNRNLIVIYFNDFDANSKIELVKEHLNKNNNTKNIKTSEYIINEEDWANSWKKFFTTKKVGKKFVIVPYWDNYVPDKNRIPIFIEPGMAFGTGHHETTELCIKLLEEFIQKNDIVIDVGTGTAILAIVAKLLGASLVLGIDNDKYAVKIARQNVKLNKCNDIKIFNGNLLSFKSRLYSELMLRKCDVIICNILKDAILKLLTKIDKFIHKNSTIIISGILENQFDEVNFSFKKLGFKNIKLIQKNDWVAATFKLKT